MALPAYTTAIGRLWYYSFRAICALVFFFLIMPIIVIVPLSFNAEPYFSFTEGMLSLDANAFSLRWYETFFTRPEWLLSVKNSFIIGIASTLLATTLGTIAALGLSKPYMPFRNVIMALLISPMIVPLIITAAAVFFSYTKMDAMAESMLGTDPGFAGGYLGLILAHTALGTPFVIITVTATLSGFDHTLSRAAASLGAPPVTTFFKIIMPLILPGVISGALFAFITSFDEVVVVLFLAAPENRTVPREMWSGIREQISPTILAAATMLVAVSIALLTVLELLRRRGERLRGIAPG